jgi:hypothetical protein
MNVNVSNLKSKFANLKFEQLLADKYFVETCFSKKFDSNPQREILRDTLLRIRTYTEITDVIVCRDCIVVEDCGCHDIDEIQVEHICKTIISIVIE